MGLGTVGGQGTVSNPGMVDVLGRKSHDTEVTLAPVGYVWLVSYTQEFSLNSGSATSSGVIIGDRPLHPAGFKSPSTRWNLKYSKGFCGNKWKKKT